jgi:polyhydroxybutyrate depolymerase
MNCNHDCRKAKLLSGLGASLLLVIGLLTSASQPALGAACTTTLKPGDSTVNLTFGGQSRSFLLHVPSSFTGKVPVPLVIDLHGFTSSDSQQKSLSGILQESDKIGFIAAWPQGLNASWNAYGCCGQSLQNKVDDVGFIRAVVANIKASAPIDNARVYVTGLSNGGSLSHRLACEANDVFAAAGPVSFPLNRTACPSGDPARPIAVYEFRGKNDTTVPFNGGGFTNFQSAAASFSAWQKINACTVAPSVQTFSNGDTCSTAVGCAAGVQVGLCALSGSHVLYNTETTINIADFMWQNHFSKFTLPNAPANCQ